MVGKTLRYTKFSLLENAFVKLPQPLGMIWPLAPHVEQPNHKFAKTNLSTIKVFF